MTAVELHVRYEGDDDPKKCRLAEEILSKFSWGHTFLELNDEPLRRYADCADSAAVVDVQDDYLVDE